MGVFHKYSPADDTTPPSGLYAGLIATHSSFHCDFTKGVNADPKCPAVAFRAIRYLAISMKHVGASCGPDRRVTSLQRGYLKKDASRSGLRIRDTFTAGFMWRCGRGGSIIEEQ